MAREQQQRRGVGAAVGAVWCGQQQVRCGAVQCGQQHQQHEQCGAGSSSGTLSISSTSTALQKIMNLRGLQKTCNKNLALLALSGLMSEMARHWQGTGKSKMRKSRQVM